MPEMGVALREIGVATPFLFLLRPTAKKNLRLLVPWKPGKSRVNNRGIVVLAETSLIIATSTATNAPCPESFVSEASLIAVNTCRACPWKSNVLDVDSGVQTVPESKINYLMIKRNCSLLQSRTHLQDFHLCRWNCLHPEARFAGRCAWGAKGIHLYFPLLQK